MPFDQHVDRQREQTLEGIDPSQTVHIWIRRGEVAAHEGVAGDQNFFDAVVQHDVVVTMSGSPEHLEFTMGGLQAVPENLEIALERVRLSDDGRANPRQAPRGLHKLAVAADT